MKTNFEKVNPCHPDKVADRIAGALVDLAYTKSQKPIIAVEVLIGHQKCLIINETNIHFTTDEVSAITNRIGNIQNPEYIEILQDEILASNQKDLLRCGDNGIFKGVPTDSTEKCLTSIARKLYSKYKSDGKYILADNLIICQSKALTEDIRKDYPDAIINPLGFWEGGTDVDTGATNRKLGSDMGRAVTGGGLHGKDLSKADVSVNIYAHLMALKTGLEVNLACAIGDDNIDGVPYLEIVDIAKDYIVKIGGFEKLAEWGLIR